MKNSLKRIFALMISLLLLLAGAAAAEPETEATTEESESPFTVVRWEDYQDEIFTSIDQVNLKMWMPDFFEEVELSQEDKDQGIIACYTNDPETLEYCAVVTLKITELKDIADYTEYVVGTGVTECELDLINDIPSLIYKIPGKDALYVAMMGSEGALLEFTFSPASDEDYAKVCWIMIASMQVEK